MKWLRSRTHSSAGNTDWTYKPLYASRITEDMKEDIDYFIEDVAGETSWSEHFRKVEWEIITTRQVPNKHIEGACSDTAASIRGHKFHLGEAKKHLVVLRQLRGKGRKTCPDELCLAKIKKMREAALAKHQRRQILTDRK